MEMQAIDAALAECKRFADAAEELKARAVRDEDFRKYFRIVGYRETAALRRASLDLTRSLAEMRRS